MCHGQGRDITNGKATEEGKKAKLTHLRVEDIESSFPEPSTRNLIQSPSYSQPRGPQEHLSPVLCFANDLCRELQTWGQMGISLDFDDNVRNNYVHLRRGWKQCG